MPACGRASVLLIFTVIAGRWFATAPGSGKPVRGAIGVFLPLDPPASNTITTTAITTTAATLPAIHRLRRTRALTGLIVLSSCGYDLRPSNTGSGSLNHPGLRICAWLHRLERPDPVIERRVRVEEVIQAGVALVGLL